MSRLCRSATSDQIAKASRCGPRAQTGVVPGSTANLQFGRPRRSPATQMHPRQRPSPAAAKLAALLSTSRAALSVHRYWYQLLVLQTRRHLGNDRTVGAATHLADARHRVALPERIGRRVTELAHLTADLAPSHGSSAVWRLDQPVVATRWRQLLDDSF